MPSFNLVDRKWIPCVYSGEAMPEDDSLVSVLSGAATIREIRDGSPLVTIAIHRFLLAILHKTFGPVNAEAWHEIWKKGNFENGRLRSYLDERGPRFDLFDERKPFYQVATLDPRYAVPAARLIHELAAKTDKTLFDHTTDFPPRALTPAEAARALLAHQAFALRGLLSYEEGEKQEKSARSGPLVGSAVVLARGQNLFETLMLNFVRYDPAADEPFRAEGIDTPAWERPASAKPETRRLSGYLDLLTWQSRRIRLIPEVRTSGPIVIRQAIILKGDQFEKDYELHDKETMIAYKRNLKPGQAPWPPVGFREDKAIWRDSHTLFHSFEGKRPKTVSWLNYLVSSGILDRPRSLPIDLFGMANDNKKVLFWRHERLPLPVASLSNPYFQESLQESIRLANEVGNLFVPGYDIVEGNAKFLRPFTVMAAELGCPAASLVKHLAPGRAYWSRLEAPFVDLLTGLGESAPLDGDIEVRFGLAALVRWAGTIRDQANRAYDEATRGSDRSARSLRAVVLARRVFAVRMKQILGGYLSLDEGGSRVESG